MKHSTQIRLGMLLIAAVFWVIDCAIDYFVFNTCTFLTFAPQKLYMRCSLVLLLVVSGELVVRLERNVTSSRDEREKFEQEKEHIFRTGLFGNSKEVRNKLIIIGQAMHMFRLGEMDSDKAFEIIERTSKQVINVLDTTQQELENQIQDYHLDDSIQVVSTGSD